MSSHARRSATTAGPVDAPAVRTRPSRARAEAARQTMEALSESRDVFATFFEQAAIGLALADLSGCYVRVNAVYAAMLGHRPEALVGVPFASVVHPDDRRDDSATALRDGARTRLEREQRYLHADGQMRWVLHGVTVVPGDDGQPVWFAVSAQDITERRRTEQELRDLAAAMSERAVRDPLTGLANRTLLLERLRDALSRDARASGGTGLLFLDLDGFKAVNDRWGHDVGDAVLREVARRLTVAVRPTDLVARLGGDEFVVLVEAPAENDLRPVVTRLTGALSAPFGDDPDSPRIGVSVGSAWVAGGDATPQQLLRRADAAMYRDKRALR